jgi:hypothetical protein
MTNPDLEAVPGGCAPVLGIEPKYFNDRELFQRIVETVFYRNWLLACHSSELSKPGDFLTLEIYDQDIIITHTREGDIRPFITYASIAGISSPRVAVTRGCWYAPTTPGPTICRAS